MKGFEMSQKTEFSLIDRLPASIELEKGVLGSVMLDGKSYKRVQEVLNEQDFVLPQHKTLFRIFGEVVNKHSILDIQFLMDHLRSNVLMEGVGGEIYLMDLIDKKFLPIPLEEAVKTIKLKSVRRKQYEFAIELLGKLKEDQHNTSNEIDQILNKLANTNKFTLDNPYVSVCNASQKFLLELVEKQITCISTGFSSIDAYIGGLFKGQLVTIAAETSMGKTTFAWQIALNLALKKIPVAYTSLEMSEREMIGKAFSVFTGVPYLKMRSLDIDSPEMGQMKNINREAFSTMPLYISEKTLNIYDIKRAARKLKVESDIQLLLIDHLHFIQNKKENETRNQEISFLTSEIKALAKELDIPIIILSQLNRSGATRLNRSPVLTDLRDSGSIEQDSDVVMFLYRPGVHTINEEPGNQIDLKYTEIIIPKNRNGERNVKVELVFNPEFSQFNEPYYKEEKEEYREQQMARQRTNYYGKD